MKSHIGMIITSTTLNTEDKVKAIYGGEHWVLIEGKMLLGVSTSHTVNSTGGSETHTLSVENLPSHAHGIPALSGTAVGGNHSHALVSDGAAYGGINNSGTPYNTGEYSYPNGVRNIMLRSSGDLTLGVVTNASTTGATGSGTAFDTMPPYKTVYIYGKELLKYKLFSIIITKKIKSIGSYFPILFFSFISINIVSNKLLFNSCICTNYS